MFAWNERYQQPIFFMFRWYLDWLGSTRPTAAGPWCTWGLNKVLVYTSHSRPASLLQHTAQRGAFRRCVCFHVFTFRLYVSSLFYILSLIVFVFFYLVSHSPTHPPMETEFWAALQMFELIFGAFKFMHSCFFWSLFLFSASSNLTTSSFWATLICLWWCFHFEKFCPNSYHIWVIYML